MNIEDLRKYITLVDDGGENLDQWNQKVKAQFGSAAYISKSKNGDGQPLYKVYASFSPNGVVNVKGEDANIQKAIDKAAQEIDTYRRTGVAGPQPPKKKTYYDEIHDALGESKDELI